MLSDTSTRERRAIPSLYIPFYGTTANGHTSAARGWNTFGIQANPSTDPSFSFTDSWFAQQCDRLKVQPGFDYVCSLDSGWSANGGDQFGRLQPDQTVFPTFGFRGFADHLHRNGLKLGVYVLPGAFDSDQNVTIEGTNIRLGDVLDFTTSYFLRRSFLWGKDGVQQWHDSVIKNFASLGVDFIKLDFLTPGSPDAGVTLPNDTSPSATAYHNSIKSFAPGMRLDLSWKLDRDEPVFSTWQNSADALRTDQDVNNSGENTPFVSFATVQRAIENYRLFINEQTQNASRHGLPIMIHPDMDNTFIGNPASVSGISDVERYTVAIHWIGAGANLITGSDLTNMDKLGDELLNNPEALSVAAFTSQYPMQPRNPSGSPTPGGDSSQQLQAWIAGPSPKGTAVVVLANYGPDQGQGGFGTSLSGVQTVNATLADLGITGTWSVRRVWGGGGSGGTDHTDLGKTSVHIGASLGPGESAMYRITKA